MSKGGVPKKGVQSPRTRKPPAQTAIDFAPDHWVIVKGEPSDIAAKLDGAEHPVEFVRFDGKPVFIFPKYVKCVGTPGG